MAQLTKAQYFGLFLRYVDSDTIRTRMVQMFDLIPAGAPKTTAIATLKADLLDAIVADQTALREREPDIARLEEAATNVNDTALE